MKALFSILSVSTLLLGAPPETLPEIGSPEVEIVSIEQVTPIQVPNELLSPPAPNQVFQTKSAATAANLSLLLPGLGHVYLGDLKMAGSIAGGTYLSGLGMLSSHKNQQMAGLVVAQNVWGYGVYAAYRDARTYNGQMSYKYQMPTDHLSDLTLAPFRFSVLKKPEVWGGFLGAFGLAAVISHFAYPKHTELKTVDFSKTSPLLALPIGIGEEALFRGYLQSQLSEVSNPWAGIALSSLAFGAAHIPNAYQLEPEHRWRYYAFSLPMITGFGAYFGWMTYKNRSLQESVALHTWYDFVLFALSSVATETAITGNSSFSFELPF